LNGSFLYPKGRRQRGGQAPCTTTAIRFSYYFVCYANLSKNSLQFLTESVCKVTASFPTLQILAIKKTLLCKDFITS